MNAYVVPFQWVSKYQLNEEPPADVMDFERNEWCVHNSKSGRIVFLRESEATATNVFCANAKRQLQMFSVAKAKRQLQLRQGEIDF
ncbi:hypothetical protein ACQKMV_19895 [Lysinibacillus sp. NPDC094403]|uniref:hypothetical protein n=1 Tax=Lysinibacillus sp. NPDC094403 TaxID=3390581 RepID=UPI003D02ED46